MGRPAVSVPRSGERDPFRITRGVRALLVTAFLGVALASGLALIPLPYAILSPGPAVNVLGNDADGKPLIEVSGASRYAAGGALDFTTVSVRGGPGNRVNVWDVVDAWLRPGSEVFDEATFFPAGATKDQVREENTAEMTGSQQEAIAVALRSIGTRVTERHVVSGVASDAPAHGVIEAGDRILAVDGDEVATLADIQRIVRSHRPGDRLSVEILRDGSRRSVTAATTAANGRTVLGITLASEFEFPYRVTIHAGDVGGPSAGLMFSLAVRDVLTPGDLTGGKRIAGTGTIDSAGVVGPIGGIRQKLIGARAAGAQYFLAPAANCPELLDTGPEVTVVKVATFEEALAGVEAIAAGKASGLPTCG